LTTELRDKMNKAKKINAFDFFCGAGGWSVGLIQAGINVLGAFDKDMDAMVTYVANLGSPELEIIFTSERYEKEFKEKIGWYIDEYGDIPPGSGWLSKNTGLGFKGVRYFFFGDIDEISGRDILEIIGMKPGELDLVVGSPPCQGFSTANPKASPNDIRNKLVISYAEKLNEMMPKAFTMEQVPGVLKWKLPNGKTYIDEFLEKIPTADTKKPIQLELFS